MRDRKYVVVCLGIVCAIFVCPHLAGAAECITTDPPETMGELFTDCADGAGYSNYFTADMDIHEEFEIDQMEAFQIGLDFSSDPDTMTAIIEANNVITMCVGRIKFKTLAWVDGETELQEGYAYSYYATPIPVGLDPVDCEDFELNVAPVLDDLNSVNDTKRPGVLFLPGFRNIASPAEAAKYAAYFSSPLANSNSGKVFVLVVAPPSHLALNQTQLGPGDCAGGREFCTVFRDETNGGFGQLSFGGKGRNNGAEEFPTVWWFVGRNNDAISQAVYGVPGINTQIHQYLTDGFYDFATPHPTRHILWAFTASALRATRLFDSYFAANGWTNGTLISGGFSLGGLVSTALLEADPLQGVTGRSVNGIFTWAAHAGINDNFRVPGNNMGHTIITSRGDLARNRQNYAPFIAWDCENPWYQSLSPLAPDIVEQMDAGCGMSRFFSVLNYEPSFDPETAILLTQGSQDEPWSVRGMERTYKYYEGYVDAGLIQMDLEGDVDHRYFVGGTPGSYSNTAWFPSEAIDEDTYPVFGDTEAIWSFLRNPFETFTNADWLNPQHSDFVDSLFTDRDSPSLGWNRLFATIRNFILYNGGYEESEAVDVVLPPPAPVKPTYGDNGVEIDLSVAEDGDDTVVRYDMTSCFDEDLLNDYDDLQIVFRGSADRLWHILPACEEESDLGIGEDTYTINVENDAYDYNSACYRFNAQIGEKFGNCTNLSTNLDTNTYHDGFTGVVTSAPAGKECRTYAVEFRGATADFQTAWDVPHQFSAWAELRAYDANGKFQSGSTSYIETVSNSSLPNPSSPYSQCVRPIENTDVYGTFKFLELLDGMTTITAEFPDEPTCTPLELDEWPISVENMYALDLRGYDVTIPSSTTLETGPAGLVIGTDCDLTIEDDATLTIDHGDDDVDSRILLIARNIEIDGSVVNDSEERGAVRVAALDSITIGATGVVSASNLYRDNEEGEGVVGLHTLGTVTLAGQLDANETVHGGAVTISGDDVTIAATAVLTADADSQETGSIGGAIGVKTTGDLVVEYDIGEPNQRAVFTATGEDEDGSILNEGCDVDAVEGDYTPTPTTNDEVCPQADLIDLESVDWCDNYEDNDLCCQVGDPCGYGFDGLCQCADSCEWDVMDCTGAPVGVQVFDADSEGPAGIVGAECVIVDNVTGEPVEPEISTTSNANGYCWFPSINGAETFSVRVTHDDYFSEFLFNLPTPALPQVYMLPTAELGDFEEYFEIEIDPEDGIVLGFVLWGGPNGHEPVGCAEITNDSGQNTVFYADEYGPNPFSMHTSPLNSGFMLFNVPTGGEYEFTATADEEEAYSTVPQVFASSITMTYLVYGGEYETNPTPAECE